MSPEVLGKAMDPFFTTKAQGKGTGLGLSMAFSAVKAHGGILELSSTPGKGTIARIVFPADPALQEPGVGTKAPVAMEAPRSLSILLVDDDELVRGSLATLLEAMGHGVTPVASGEEALVMLEGGSQPDVVVLDMNMPGLGGAGTLPRIRALKPDLPVLLATGRADQTALDLVQNHPHVTLVKKPFGMEELRRYLPQS